MILYEQQSNDSVVYDHTNLSLQSQSNNGKQAMSNWKCFVISILILHVLGFITVTTLIMIQPIIYRSQVSLIYISQSNEQTLSQSVDLMNNNFMGLNAAVFTKYRIQNNTNYTWPNIKFVQYADISSLVSQLLLAVKAFQTQYVLLMPGWFTNYNKFLETSLIRLEATPICAVATVNFDSLPQFENQMFNVPALYRSNYLAQILTKLVVTVRHPSQRIMQIYLMSKFFAFLKSRLQLICYIDFPMQYKSIAYQYRNKQEKKQVIAEFTQDVRINNNSVISLFNNRSHNAKYLNGLLDYLKHNEARIVLMINCRGQCIVNLFDEPTFAHFDFDFQQFQEQKTIKANYDWINCDDLLKCFQFLSNHQEWIDKARFGVSYRHKEIKFQNLQAIKQLDQMLEQRGLFYDEIKSLNLMHPERQIVRLYVRGRRNTSQPYEGYRRPTANFLGIQVVFRMIENLPYLREWLGYHVNLGVDKFFLYDNSNSQRSEWQRIDYKVTKTTSKLGLDFACFNLTEAEVLANWTAIWEQYYNHIVYVIWEPHDQDNRIIYGQLRSLEDYMDIYSMVTQFTCFIDIDQMLFSQRDIQIEDYLTFKLKNNVTSLKLRPRHFASRFCFGYKKVTEIIDHFADPNDTRKIEGPKIVGVTKYFIPFGSIHEGRTSIGRQQMANFEDLRFHHFRVSTKKQMLRDDSLHRRYEQQINKICKSGCSDSFALSCPQGKQYGQCAERS